MHPHILNDGSLAPETRQFYCDVLAILFKSNIPFLAGGAYALACYTGIVRDTKDFDVFCLEKDAKDILGALGEAGYKTELTDEIWLAKAFCNDNLVDIIFGSANGLAQVDEEWFTFAQEGQLLDFTVELIPPEEMIWSKSFIMTRNRYDLADIVHVILHQAQFLDWTRLLRRFDGHWRVLYNYLILFGYIYPNQRHLIPVDLMKELTDRLQNEIQTSESGPLCRGTLFSTTDYLIDVTQWGYIDPRTITVSNQSAR
jgi:hypothetical protein